MIFLVRHAESEANVGMATSSPEKIQITENGQRFAVKFADKIKIAPDLIVISEHERTRQTAQPLIDKYPESLLDIWAIHEFTYLSPASCINTTKEDRRSRVEDYWAKCDPDYVHGPGAESFSAFFKRINACYSRVKDVADLNTYIFSHEQAIKLLELIYCGEMKEPSSEAMKIFRHKLCSLPIKNLQVLEIDVKEKRHKKLFINWGENHIKSKQLLEKELIDISTQDLTNIEFCKVLKSLLEQFKVLDPLLSKAKAINWRFSEKRNLESVRDKFREDMILMKIEEPPAKISTEQIALALREGRSTGFIERIQEIRSKWLNNKFSPFTFDDPGAEFLAQKVSEIDHSWSSIDNNLFIRSTEDLNKCQSTLFWLKAIIQDYDRLGRAMGIDSFKSGFFTFRDKGVHQFESATVAFNYLSKMQTRGLEKDDTKFFKIKLRLYGYESYNVDMKQVKEAESLGVELMNLYCLHFDDNVKIEDILWVGKVVRTPYLKKPGLLKVATDLLLVIGRKDILGRQLSPLTNYRKRVQNRRGFDRELFRKKALLMLLSQMHKNSFDIF